MSWASRNTARGHCASGVGHTSPVEAQVFVRRTRFSPAVKRRAHRTPTPPLRPASIGRLARVRLLRHPAHPGLSRHPAGVGRRVPRGVLRAGRRARHRPPSAPRVAPERARAVDLPASMRSGVSAPCVAAGGGGIGAATHPLPLVASDTAGPSASSPCSPQRSPPRRAETREGLHPRGPPQRRRERRKAATTLAAREGPARTIADLKPRCNGSSCGIRRLTRGLAENAPQRGYCASDRCGTQALRARARYCRRMVTLAVPADAFTPDWTPAALCAPRRGATGVVDPCAGAAYANARGGLEVAALLTRDASTGRVRCRLCGAEVTSAADAGAWRRLLAVADPKPLAAFLAPP